MEKNLKLLITGLLLITLSSAVLAQRGIRRWSDSSAVSRPGREMRMRQIPALKEYQDTIRRGIGRGYGYLAPGSRGGWVMPFPGFPFGYGPRYFYCPGRVPFTDQFRFRGRDLIRPLPPVMRPVRPQIPYIYRIPDLTEKQKQEIDALREKFRAETDKFREENRKKMEEMRNSHLEKIKNLLTPEQKKWLEERTVIVPKDKEI
ncbi:MAG: Spy/CpxP family protein refolding chaperone [Bacteroidales bacterium]